MTGKTVLVLGGGIGGVTAALEARHLLDEENEVILVDRNGAFTFQGTFLWTLTGIRKPEDFSRDLEHLNNEGISILKDEVRGLDLDAMRVQTTSGEISYDYLVIATGMDPVMDAIPGLAESGYNLYDPYSLVHLGEAIEGFQGGRFPVVISPPPYKCPAAPYEAVLLLDALLRQRGIRDRVQLEVYPSEKLPLPVAGPTAGQAVVEFLAGRDIAFHGEHMIQEVDSSARRVTFTNGARVGFDLLAVVPPHRTAQFVRESGLANEAGWIPADTHRFTTKRDNVFAIGDVATVPLPAGGNLPKAGVFAKGAGQTVARNIAADIDGTEGEDFRAVGGCFLDTADGRSFLVGGDFYAFPTPAIELKGPARRYHWQKIWFERSSIHAV